jgi:DNA-binding MarR family transcriptional regulator
MSKITEETAHQVLEVVPAVMRTIRAEFRGERSTNLSVPQFRALAYIKNNNGASLSSLARHIGLTLPSMSKLIDDLVSRGLVARNEHQEDRRKICLQLTPTGKKELEAAYDHTQAFLVKKLSGLAKEDLNTVLCSMQILSELFVSDHL